MEKAIPQTLANFSILCLLVLWTARDLWFSSESFAWHWIIWVE